MSKSSLLQYAAAGITAAAIAFAAYAAGNAHSTQPTTAAAAPAAQSQAGGQPPSTGQSGGQFSPGQVPGGGQAPPGFGTPVTGTAATKAANAALAKYPGSVEAVLQLQDGSYVVHVITSAGEWHVAVSSAFRVTGADQRGGFRGGPPSGDGGLDDGAGTTQS